MSMQKDVIFAKTLLGALLINSKLQFSKSTWLNTSMRAKFDDAGASGSDVR